MEPNYPESPTDGSPNTSSEPQQEQDSNSSNYNAIEEWLREFRLSNLDWMRYLQLFPKTLEIIYWV